MWGGLALAHTRAHLYRATLESVAFGGRAVLEALSRAGVATREIVMTGGGARSDLWMQIHADVMGRPLHRLAATQPVTLGAAICAAVGVGIYPDLPAAAASMTCTRPGWRPVPERRQAYKLLYSDYLQRLAAANSANEVCRTTPDQGAAVTAPEGMDYDRQDDLVVPGRRPSRASPG